MIPRHGKHDKVSFLHTRLSPQFHCLMQTIRAEPPAEHTYAVAVRDERVGNKCILKVNQQTIAKQNPANNDTRSLVMKMEEGPQILQMAAWCSA